MQRTHIERFLPTPLVVLAFMLSYAGLYAMELPILLDNDIGWHIAAGDLIRAQGAIPARDPWSFSGSAQPWYNLSWLWDALLSIIHQHFGLAGVHIFGLLGPSLLVAALLASLQKRGAGGVNALLFTGFISFLCVGAFAYARPQIVGLFLALAFHHLLHESRSTPYAKRLFLLPVLMLAWVNLHGSFIVGFCVLGTYGLEALYRKDRIWFFRLLLIGVLCLLVLPMNAYGLHLFDAMARALHSVINEYIDEWKPFTPGQNLSVTLWLLVFLAVSNMRSAAVPLADRILTFLWVAATFYSLRNSAFLLVLAAPYLAICLPPDEGNDRQTRRLSGWLLAAALLLVPASAALLPVIAPQRHLEDPATSPAAAIAYTAQHYAGKRLLNEYNLGGRIIFDTRGALPIFVDGRAGTVYSEQVLSDYIAFMTLSPDWQRRLSSYGIEAILVPPTHAFAQAYTSGQYRETWRETYRDNAAILYIKKPQKKKKK